jgi:hypothetical protein
LAPPNVLMHRIRIYARLIFALTLAFQFALHKRGG